VSGDDDLPVRSPALQQPQQGTLGGRMKIGLRLFDDEGERRGLHQPDSEGHQELLDACTQVLEV
jgi:hypothetical protein